MKTPPSILLVLSDESKRTEIQSQLADHYPILEAKTCREAIQLLRDPNVGMALIHGKLSDGNSLRLVERIRAHENFGEFPILFLESDSQKHCIREAFDSGASDFLSSPLCPATLQARIQNALKQREIYHHLKKRAEHIQKSSNKDPLTGVENRASLEEHAIRELAKASRWGSSVGLMVIDLDRFKQLNDTYGHQCGDQALMELAYVLRWNVRAYDIVGRYGGDEFVILLPEAGDEEVEQVRKKLEDHSLSVSWNGEDVSFSISIGTASMVPSSGSRKEYRESFAKLFKTADTHLYQIKRQRKDES